MVPRAPGQNPSTTGANDTPEALEASRDTMSNRLVRAGAVRVLANALLVLLAFEVVSLAIGVAQMIVSETPPPVSPIELVLVAVVFYLIRWIVVLPGLLLVLAGIEVAARRVPHARLLTAIVAFAPMVWWQLTQSSGDTSGFSAVLGVTAVLFAVLARLPDGLEGRSTDDHAPAQPPAESAVAPH